MIPLLDNQDLTPLLALPKINGVYSNLFASLKIKNRLQLPNVKTGKYGIENIRCIGHYLWASLPEKVKDSDTLTNFKQNMD